MLDSISAHVELIEENNVFGEVVANAMIGNIIRLIERKYLFALQIFLLSPNRIGKPRSSI